MRYTTLCYLENPAGEYLMLHRVKKENDCNRDKWIGIGGKFLDGESPEECALREINEETGLTVTGYRYRGIVTFVSDRWETEYMHLFTATEWTGRVREDCDEGVLEWIHKDRLAALPQWAGDRIFLDLLRQGAPFFSLKLRYQGETLVYACLNGKELTLGRFWSARACWGSPAGTTGRARPIPWPVPCAKSTMWSPCAGKFSAACPRPARRQRSAGSG